MTIPYILIVFVSDHGSTKNLAQSIARGVNAFGKVEARLRTVPRISALLDVSSSQVDESSGQGDIALVTTEDLANCAGLAIGSPTHFGNMASSLQYWIESTTSLWFSGALIDKPVGVFTSSASMHGGQETTLINLLTPLLHHGMCVVGVPYSNKQLGQTQTGGTPYGATHVAGGKGVNNILSDDEHAIAVEQGRRLAKFAWGVYNDWSSTR